jgi:hypothetical protein
VYAIGALYRAAVFYGQARALSLVIRRGR